MYEASLHRSHAAKDAFGVAPAPPPPAHLRGGACHRRCMRPPPWKPSCTAYIRRTLRAAHAVAGATLPDVPCQESRCLRLPVGGTNDAPRADKHEVLEDVLRLERGRI